MTESSSTSDERKTLRRTVQLPANSPPLANGKCSLRLCMLGCEDHPPYGPTEATGALFLELVTSAIYSAYPFANAGPDKTAAAHVDFDIIITTFRVQVMDYPDGQWDDFDGILIPGSFSSAYETAPWIERLKDVIQKEIYGKKRKTLAVCFGHQLYAHSFNQQDGQGGLCRPCPRGHQAGRRSSSLTREGSALLIQPTAASLSSDTSETKPKAETIQLMYTHGDHVASLPPCAVSLFGNDAVPIQAAAYFADNEEAATFCEIIGDNGQKRGENLPSLPQPHAFTFQAHPEYSSQDGLTVTFTNILTALEERKALPPSDLAEAKTDTTDNFPELQQESISLFVTVCKILGW
eukprot:CAMPEP_0181044378 /NCGR_PEP_ID=MMETSP1070-20121207/13233_1 /TAXON_ID=265543 /ORGANISM="Minutocellus polymorphus, Strain NH13" /LENGTH=349 /DNA_ID=CAMNT_0023122817 /DNA_START=76 /DNA_END=1122 /DNA_ORIENTATION=-